MYTLQDYGLSLDIVTEMYEKQWNLRVRWNPERYRFLKWILVIVIQLVSFKAYLRRSCLGSPCVVVLLDCKEKDNNATLGLKSNVKTNGICQ